MHKNMNDTHNNKIFIVNNRIFDESSIVTYDNIYYENLNIMTMF